ncbi:MAG: Vi polysaccharide biosynthesis UDP-N-acetylglucosamine dehydrogenase TviB, partial [Bacteroidota bacterium]
MTQNQTISPTIAIVGLGYVGLPLALAFAKPYTVIGFDINEKRVSDLQNSHDITLECTEAEIKNAKHLTFTSSLSAIKEATIFIVTVPTPVDADKRPNLQPLVEATAMIGSVLKKGDLVIYESTVYPGCTEEDCVPVLEKQSSLVFNKDFYVGYSPERINPGDKVHTLTTIKKLTAGS